MGNQDMLLGKAELRLVWGFDKELQRLKPEDFKAHHIYEGWYGSEADKYLGPKRKHLNKAIEYFKAAGAPQKLILCGDKCLEQKWLRGAIDAYLIAKAKKKLEACGHLCLQEGLLDLALDAYKGADVLPPKSAVIAQCKNLLEDSPWQLKDILAICKAAGVVPKNELSKELVACGKSCCSRDWFTNAFWIGLKAYEAADVKPQREILDNCGNKFLKEGYWKYNQAVAAFKITGNKNGLRKAADFCLIEAGNGRKDEAPEFEALALSALETAEAL